MNVCTVLHVKPEKNLGGQEATRGGECPPAPPPKCNPGHVVSTASSGHWNCVIIHTIALTTTSPEHLYIIIVLKLMYIHFR